MTNVKVMTVGGGTTGRRPAARLVGLPPASCAVTPIESEEIGIVGVGEATLPHLRPFIGRFGIDEAASIAATYKLGIAFRDSACIGDRYIHPFGTFGQVLGGVAWPGGAQVYHTFVIGDFSAGLVAARQCRFKRPGIDPQDPTTSFGYAYQFATTRFAPCLRAWAEARSAPRIEVRVAAIADGQRVEGNLFIDCSGFRSPLLGSTRCKAWENWSRGLRPQRGDLIASALYADAATAAISTRARDTAARQLERPGPRT